MPLCGFKTTCVTQARVTAVGPYQPLRPVLIGHMAVRYRVVELSDQVSLVVEVSR